MTDRRTSDDDLVEKTVVPCHKFSVTVEIMLVVV